MPVTTYELLLFGHILFVITWVGTNIGMHVLGARALAAGSRESVDLVRNVEFLGKFLLTPAALLVIVFGALLVEEVGYDWSQTWIVLALAAYGFSFVLGTTFLGPESGRIARLADERGPEDPEVQRRTRRLLWPARFELLLLVAIVLDMIAKPGL